MNVFNKMRFPQRMRFPCAILRKHLSVHVLAGIRMRYRIADRACKRRVSKTMRRRQQCMCTMPDKLKERFLQLPNRGSRSGSTIGSREGGKLHLPYTLGTIRRALQWQNEIETSRYAKLLETQLKY